MLTGKRFKLRTPTLAIDMKDGKRELVTVPAESVVVVSRRREADAKMIDVLWEGRTVIMFSFDVVTRGTEINDLGFGAQN